MPALSRHGRSFSQGVRFSVQTASRGNAPYRRLPSFDLNPQRGAEKAVEDSKKLIDAQNRPDNVCVRFFHVASMSAKGRSKTAHSSTPGGFALSVNSGSNPPHVS